MVTEPFKQQMRLVFQGNIPVTGNVEGKLLYEDVKIYIRALHPKATLSGQLITMLEPCCKDRKEKKTNEKSP